MKLIVGLGNPGKEYENTRHNIGYMVLDSFLSNEKWKEDKHAFVIKDGQKALFIKPTTFMNLSGTAVKYYSDYYKIDPKSILVIQDDLDSTLGSIKLKDNSSSGGHNGIKDIINKLHTENFPRIKIGISHPENDVIDYVLAKFSKTELNTINNAITTAHNIIRDFINDEEIITIQGKYNQKGKKWNF